MRLQVNIWALFAILRRQGKIAGRGQLARRDRVRVGLKGLLLRLLRRLPGRRRFQERWIFRDERRRCGQVDNRKLNRFVFHWRRGTKRTAEGSERESHHEMHQQRDQNRQPQFPVLFRFRFFHHAVRPPGPAIAQPYFGLQLGAFQLADEMARGLA